MVENMRETRIVAVNSFGKKCAETWICAEDALPNRYPNISRR
ncbi:hypothetical protein HMPREF0653_01097 [Prevotella disiens JCM 6334 = ATCC 29426]|uniref:Uncharacterized protein n=1 Tax=Prevotella disiens JCM 6334 = ATCC 29426 TaxID=1235811 RepID=A0ABN0NSQ0_9BACT|nr:hypothetical protein HMPREF0653_01097 [Prevotella disiens JCM 6334 = ATCC 29426]